MTLTLFNQNSITLIHGMSQQKTNAKAHYFTIPRSSFTFFSNIVSPILHSYTSKIKFHICTFFRLDFIQRLNSLKFGFYHMSGWLLSFYFHRKVCIIQISCINSRFSIVLGQSQDRYTIFIFTTVFYGKRSMVKHRFQQKCFI